MNTTVMMSAGECQEVVNRILLAYPTLAGDAERCQEISRKMEQFPYAVALQAVDEYVDHGGDKFLELTRLLAVAYRVFREMREREAAIAKALERQGERATEQHIRDTRASVVTFIAEMTDDEVMAEWRPLLEQMTGLPRQWAEQWGPEKVRNNVRFQFHMAQLMQRRISA